jgi:glycosyltransferase involved in cell wall biosynthesis
MTPADTEAFQLWEEIWQEQRKFINAIFAAGFLVRPLEKSVSGFYYQVETGEQPARKFMADLNGVPRINVTDVEVVELKGKLSWSEREKAFYDAAVVIVPSRFEPFGMVVLEAMQHGAPVLFPKSAGVAEVVRSGVAIDPEDVTGTADVICRLLDDAVYWTQVVEAQYDEIEEYAKRDYEEGLIKVWNYAISGTASRPAPRIPPADYADRPPVGDFQRGALPVPDGGSTGRSELRDVRQQSADKIGSDR